MTDYPQKSEQGKFDEKPGIYCIRDLSLAKDGKLLIDWAESRMPVLMALREKYSKTKPFKGYKVAGCLHVTKETAVLIKTFIEAGAEISWSGCNPLSTNDAVAAALAADGISIYAWYDNGPFNTYFRNKATYYGLRIYKDSPNQNVIGNEVGHADGSLADISWNVLDIQDEETFVLGNTNLDEPSPPDAISEDLSLYLDPEKLPEFLSGIEYFPPFGAVDDDHQGE